MRARALEAQGRNIIHLEIGEPDFETPRHIRRGRQAGASTKAGRTTVRRRGCRNCAKRSQRTCRRTRGIQVGPEHVCVVPGGKPIIFFPMLALLEPGDEVIYPNPGFPIYESMIRFLGATPVPMPLLEERGFSFDLDTLSRAG